MKTVTVGGIEYYSKPVHIDYTPVDFRTLGKPDGSITIGTTYNISTPLAHAITPTDEQIDKIKAHFNAAVDAMNDAELFDYVISLGLKIEVVNHTT